MVNNCADEHYIHFSYTLVSIASIFNITINIHCWIYGAVIDFIT